MNELIFIVQAALVFYLTKIWTRSGKEALFLWMGFLACLANLFVTKQVSLFGLDVTASDVYMIGLFLSLNVVQEYWGRDAGKTGIRWAFRLQLAFLALSQLHLWMTPNSFDLSQPAFETILGIYPRILLASVSTLWLVQQWDLYFFNFLKKRFKNLSFSFRNTLALGVSQALDTTLFSILALWGEVGNLVDIWLMSFLIKCLLIALTPFLIPYLRPHATEISLRDPS